MKNLLYIFLFLPFLALAQTQPRANQIRVTPGGNVAATNLQDAVNEIDGEKAGKNMTWIVKTANYTPVATDTLFTDVAFSMRSATDLSFTIPSFGEVNFNEGTKFRIKNDSINVVSILPGSGVAFKCITDGPWTLNEDEYAIATKSNSTNTWELELFKEVNFSSQTNVALFTETATVGNVTTGEDVLFTYTLGAGDMSSDGNSILARFSGTLEANGNSKTIKVKFGGTNVVNVFGTFTSVWTINCEFIRTSATTQKCNCTTVGASAGLTHSAVQSASETLSGAVTIQLTGEATATNDIVLQTATGRFDPGVGGTTPPPIEPPEIPFVIIDNATRGDQGYEWDYNSSWAAPGIGVEGWYDETLDYTGTTNADAEITFNGTRVQFYTEKKNTHGIVEVSLDGVVVDTVDLYSSTALLQQLVFDSGDEFDEDNEEGPLTQSVHTLKLRCTGTKNGSSSAFYILVDYVKIENPGVVPEDPDPEPSYTHFVATTGSNGGANNCETEGSPCLTIAYALTQAGSGDVIYVADGTYVETSYLVVAGGESIHGQSTAGTIVKVNSSLNANTTIDQAKCIFQLTAASSTASVISYLSMEGNAKLVHGGIYIDTDRNNVTVDNVKISNFDYFGAFVGGNGHTFTNVEIINSAETSAGFSTGALMITTSEDFLCDNVDISEGEGYGVKAWTPGAIIESHIFRNSEIRVITTSAVSGGLPNIAYELHNCYPRNCLFENNYVDNCVSIIRPTSFDNDAIPSIHIKNNTLDMITKGSGTAVNTPLEIGAHNVEISHNHLVGGRFAFIVHWNASETEPAINWDIHHNTFYYTGSINLPTAAVRSSYAPLQDVDIFNNTFHIPTAMNYTSCIVMTGQGSVGEQSSDVNIINNVIYDQSTADTGTGGANSITRMDGSGGSWTSCNFTYNTIVGMSSSLPGGWTANNTLTNGPSFIGGGGVNPSPFVYDPFYRPAAGSPLLNSGTDVGFGATPDRGRIQDP